MKARFGKAGILAGVIALGLALAGPRDNSLVVGASQEPRVLGDFWNFITAQAIASEIEAYLWSGLEFIDQDGNDRDDIYWSDGTPITTRDVAFWFEVGKHPGAPLQDPTYWERLKEVRVLDDKNFVVVFEPAFFYDTVGSAVGLAPEHVMRAKWEETKAEIAKLDPKKDAEKITDLFHSEDMKSTSRR